MQDPDSVEQDVVLTFGKFVREIGLQNGVVTLRCDNEAFLIKICGILAKRPKSWAIGPRPEARGNVERQVAVVKQAFWSNWLEVDVTDAKASARGPALEDVLAVCEPCHQLVLEFSRGCCDAVGFGQR